MKVGSLNVFLELTAEDRLKKSKNDLVSGTVI